MLCASHNILCIAPTGSGKTLAYALPLVEFALMQEGKVNAIHLSKKNDKKRLRSAKKDGPLGLVMVPTRELVQQVHRTIKGVCRVTRVSSGKKAHLKTIPIYGGESKKDQIEAYQESIFVHILVATPGRLIDLLADKVFSLSNVCCLVLDEAD